MINISILELVHLITTAMMVSIIWLVQILHYPTFLYIDIDRYTEFQNFHMKNISFLIIPLMLLEFLTGFLLLFFVDEIDFYFSISFGLLVLLWLITASFFSKYHSALSNKYERGIILKLIRLNWVRTFFWTARLGLLLKLF
tara:strand:- start:673 stop:1095 length:423 start_codon:yes stop_codon:yes gene_type:complete